LQGPVGNVANDGKEPWLCRRAAKAGECPESPHVGILDNILRLLAAAHDPVGQIERRLQVWRHQFFKWRLCDHSRPQQPAGMVHLYLDPDEGEFIPWTT